MARFDSMSRKQTGQHIAGCALAIVLASYYVFDWQYLVRAVGAADAWPEARLAFTDRNDTRASPSEYGRPGDGVTIIIAPEAPNGGTAIAELGDPPIPQWKRDARAALATVIGVSELVAALPEGDAGRDAGYAVIELTESPDGPAVPVRDAEANDRAILIAKLPRAVMAPDDPAMASRLPGEWAVPPKFDRASVADLAVAKLPDAGAAPRYEAWLEPDLLSMKMVDTTAAPVDRRFSDREDEEFQLIAAYRVPHKELQDLRGGFTTPSGLEINFGITLHSIVNGIPQLTTVFTTGESIGDAVASLAAAGGAHVTIGNNGGVTISQDVDVVSAVMSGGDVVLSAIDPAGTEVSHLIGPSGIAVEILNTNNNTFIQTQTEISLVLENMSTMLPVFQGAQRARNISNSLRGAVLGSLSN